MRGFPPIVPGLAKSLCAGSRTLFIKVLASLLFFCGPDGLRAGTEAVAVVDDTGRLVEVSVPPQRIVSLAPHLTEILFSLGVGEHLVGTVSHSDYPDAAKKVPVLGDAFSVSVEAVVAAEPGLILGWTSGGNARVLDQLRSFGFPVYMNEPATLEGVGDTVYDIALLCGVSEQGKRLRREYLERLSRLGATKPDRGPRVFFQIADSRLYTVNGAHLIGQALALCGADNIFGNVSIQAPMVSLEQVVALDPEIIVVAQPHAGLVSSWVDDWRRLGWLGRLRYIEASEITRPGLRLLQGAENLCRLLGKG